MFFDQYKIDRRTVVTTLMVTTSYEKAVLAGTAFFVSKDAGRHVTYTLIQQNQRKFACEC